MARNGKGRSGSWAKSSAISIFILLRHPAGSGARYFVSKISLGTGWLNNKPCISSRLSNRSRRDCSSVSTPSATTLSFSECASLMTVDTPTASSATISGKIAIERMPDSTYFLPNTTLGLLSNSLDTTAFFSLIARAANRL